MVGRAHGKGEAELRRSIYPLDPARRFELGETLRGLAGSGRTLLITSHDDDFVRDVSTRVVVLAGGRVVEEGSPQQVLTTPAHEETRRLLQVERARAGRHSS